MNSRFAARFIALTLMGALPLSSCSGVTSVLTPAGGAAKLQPGAYASGSVGLPPGSTIAMSSLLAIDTFGAQQVGSSGTFRIGTVDGDPQLVAVMSSSGTPLLQGWLGPSEPVINATTTAEVDLYFAIFGYTLPDVTSHDELVASIHTLPGLATVANAISAALLANPAASPSSSSTVQEAIANLVASLGGSSASAHLISGGRPIAEPEPDAARRGRDVILVNPGTSRAGLTIIPGEDGFSFQIQNTLRLSGTAFIDEVSHVDAATGATVTDQADDTNPPKKIAAVGAIGSFLGSVSDYLNGAYALIPTTTEEIPTPNLAGATSTQYRVAIARAAANLGDYAMLTGAEQEAVTEEAVETIIFEAVLPLIAAILVPAAKTQGSGVAIFSAGANGAIKDVITVLASDARVKAAAQSGDPKAIFDIVTADLAASATLTDKLVEGVVEVLGLAGPSVAAAAAQKIAKSLVLPIELVDGGIALVDVLSIISDQRVADKGDIFTITASNSGVTLLPATSSIGPNATVTLTAAVHPPPSQAVVYQYTTSPGFYGTLTDNTGAGHMNNFTSSSATVTYTANSVGGGTDTITVTPELVVTGQPNTPLTPATATVTVSTSPSPSPSASATPGCVPATPTPPNTYTVYGCPAPAGPIGTFSYTYTGTCPPGYPYGCPSGSGTLTNGLGGPDANASFNIIEMPIFQGTMQANFNLSPFVPAAPPTNDCPANYTVQANATQIIITVPAPPLPGTNQPCSVTYTTFPPNGSGAYYTETITLGYSTSN